MNWPDLALREETRLLPRSPRPEPQEGFIVMHVNLTALFELAQEVGLSAALMLVVVKALRTRYGAFRMRVYDLAWRMGVSHRRIVRWLDRLMAHGVVVYTLQDFFDEDTVDVEIAAITTTRVFDRSVQVVLPTHHIEHALPPLGVTTFAVYLYLLMTEERGGFHIDHLVAVVGLRSKWQAYRHLARLRKRGILVRDTASDAFVLRDPKPLSQRAQLRLRYRRQPFLRTALIQIAFLLLALMLLVLLNTFL